jgi:hypothetical protein
MIPTLAEFNEILAKADAAGREAVSKLTVIPMIVGQAKSLFSNEIDYSKPTEYVADGVCGFAWINVYPEFKGNTKLGKEERKVLEAAGFSKDWENNKRFYLWVRDFNQSLQKKETYARAFAKVVSENGVTASSMSRID